VKIYRILYERIITEQMDIPADRVGGVDGYDATFMVRDLDDKVIAVIPTDKLIGCGLVELPDPPPAVSDEPGPTE
jgi:hypothetical protein